MTRQARLSRHALLDACARKYIRDGGMRALFAKPEGRIGEYATIPLDSLAGLLGEVRAARKGKA